LQHSKFAKLIQDKDRERERERETERDYEFKALSSNPRTKISPEISKEEHLAN
jgi:hypothetical protein